MATYESPESLHFKDYWQVFRSRLGIVLTLFVIILATGYVWTAYFVTKQYGGTTAIRILRVGQEKDIHVFDPNDGQYFDPIFFESEKETLESKTVLYPVIKSLDLQKVWSERYYNGAHEMNVDEVYLLLKSPRHLSIEPRRGSNILDITAYSEDTNEAPRIANAIAAEYISYRTSTEESKSTRGLDSLQDQIKQQQAVVDAAKKNIEDIRLRDHIDISATETNDTQLDDELQRKEQMLDEQRSDTVARQVRFDSLKNLTTEQLIDTLPALGLDDANISEIRQQQLQAQSNMESLLKSGYGADHPRVQSLQASISKLGDQLSQLADGKRKALEIDLAVSTEKLNLLQKDVDGLREQVRSERSEKMTPYLDAVKEADRQQLLLDQLNIRYKQESVDTGVQGDPAQIISQAEPWPDPVKPVMWKNLLFSGIIGVILSLSVAFFIEYLDTSVKTLTDVEKTLGAPVLTIVPKGTKTLNKETEDSPHAESYRILRARIDLQAGANGGNSITILSGGPGEGKSTTLFNLGFVCAQSGQSTVIIDADLRRPSLHTILGLPLSTGLSDFLEAGGSIAPYLRATAIPNLHVVLAGTRPAEAKSLFNSEAVRKILDELKQMYQVVLIDSPPALGVSDASVISHEVDKTVLVIQHRRYPREVSLRAKRAIEDVQGNLIGVVLNNVALNTHEGYYYYGAYADYYNKPQKGGAARRGRPKIPTAAPDAPSPGTNGHSDEF